MEKRLINDNVSVSNVDIDGQTQETSQINLSSKETTIERDYKSIGVSHANVESKQDKTRNHLY